MSSEEPAGMTAEQLLAWLSSRRPATRATAYKVTDERGVRTLIVPAGEDCVSTPGLPEIKLLEALTGTRLKDGQNPARYFRFYGQYRKQMDPAGCGGVSFADFVRHWDCDWIDVTSKKTAPAEGAAGTPKAPTGGKKTKGAPSGTGGRPVGSINKTRKARREAMEHKLKELTSGPDPLPKTLAERQVAQEFQLLDKRGRPDREQLHKELKALKAQRRRQEAVRK